MRIVIVIAALILALPMYRTALAAAMDAQPAPTLRSPEYNKGKQAIDDKNWSLALASFKQALSKDPNNADIYSYMGFAYRKSGDLDSAFKSYGEALRIDPQHKGAHEYLGEAYLETKNLAKAEEHLAALDKICFFSCEEFRTLKKAVDDFKQQQAKK
jgi:tetratricopeptide (TPR) repeat protein